MGDYPAFWAPDALPAGCWCRSGVRLRHARAARALELLLDDLARLATDDATFALDPAYRRLVEAGPSAPLLAPLQALREAHRQVRGAATSGDADEPPDPVARATARLLEALGDATSDLFSC